VQNRQSIRIFQYKITVSVDISVPEMSVSEDVPVQNSQSVNIIFQHKIVKGSQ
jgi:hypothetical protein